MNKRKFFWSISSTWTEKFYEFAGCERIAIEDEDVEDDGHLPRLGDWAVVDRRCDSGTYGYCHETLEISEIKLNQPTEFDVRLQSNKAQANKELVKYYLEKNKKEETKFWEITIEKISYTIRSGIKHGVEKETKTKTFETYEEATEKAHRQIQKRYEKGSCPAD